MGKALRGRRLGVGICQTKDKKYVGRITTRNGKCTKRVFDKLADCRKQIVDARYEDEHNTINALEDMTVTAWFDYWITEIKGSNIRPNTIRNYTERFNHNIKGLIGNMLLNEVKPLHCQNVLNQMADTYRNSTIQQTSITLYGLFESAVENGLIPRNPMTKAVKCTTGKASKPKRVLTVEEQKLFLEATRGTSNYNQYALILQTELRTGEMIGLKWCDIDLDKKVLHVRRSLECRYPVGEWEANKEQRL